jgi:hypothetical protein
MSFKDDFARTPAGPQREALVYRTVLSDGKPTDLSPVTVEGPGGAKITYYVTRDFLHADGVWLPMTGVTAQKVADYFGMYLPTPKMSKQIFQAATTKIMPPPLSATGYGQYSAQQVVQSRIGASDAALAYSQRIADAQQGHGGEGIVAGHMKDITQPPPSGNLGLYGWYGKDGKPVQNSYYTPHSTNDHTEYGSGVRLVDSRVEVEYPGGQLKQMTMDQLLSSDLHSAVSDTPGIARYDVKKDKADLASVEKEVGPRSSEVAEYTPPKTSPSAGRMSLLQRVDQFFSELDKA